MSAIGKPLPFFQRLFFRQELIATDERGSNLGALQRCPLTSSDIYLGKDGVPRPAEVGR